MRMKKIDKVEKMLRAKGFTVVGGETVTKVTALGLFTREQHDSVLEIVDKYGLKISHKGAILIYHRSRGEA